MGDEGLLITYENQTEAAVEVKLGFELPTDRPARIDALTVKTFSYPLPKKEPFLIVARTLGDEILLCEFLTREELKKLGGRIVFANLTPLKPVAPGCEWPG